MEILGEPTASNDEISEDMLEATEPIASATAVPIFTRAAGSLGLVVLIDDSLLATKTATTVLIAANYQVLVVRTAQAGYDLLLAYAAEVKLVLLEIVLPGTDGVECLGWIKSNPDTARVPVHMLTGLQDEVLTGICLDQGAESLLLKPFTSSTLTHIATKNTDRDASPRSGQAFKLLDSDCSEFVFPFQSPKPLLLLFLPTIYCPCWYQADGFLMKVFAQLDCIEERRVIVAAVCGDLPFALAAAKSRFKIPFTLLSDPSLFVSQRYVGSMDIGRALYVLDHPTAADADHPQHSYMGPALGMVLVNQKRQILRRWAAAMDASGSAGLQQFPDNFADWLTDPDRTTTQSAPSALHTEPNVSEVQASYAKKDIACSAPARGNGKSVLLVDTSTLAIRTISKQLTALGYGVTAVRNSSMAFGMLCKDPKAFCVVLIDVACDGIELLKDIKEDPALAPIPVIMMSSLDVEQLRAECRGRGALDLLKKPFDSTVFQDLVH